MDQPKLERLLRLMMLLTSNVRYSVEEVAAKTGMSVRTIYRYLDTFREAGFVIKRIGDKVKIDKSSPYFKEITQLVHFTEEEAYILKSSIESIDENNVIKQNLKKKLYAVYDYKFLADSVVKGKAAKNVNNLVAAISEKKQVIMQDYHSSHSRIVNNRVVEPFAFTTNYIQIWAYEPASGMNKLFKLARIGKVVVTEDGWQFENLHQSGYMDLFRISSFDQHRVVLRLGMRAAALLVEEFPLAEKELIKENDYSWLLDTKVCTFDGVGRFVLGLCDDIEIIEPQELKNYIHQKIITIN